MLAPLIVMFSANVLEDEKAATWLARASHSSPAHFANCGCLPSPSAEHDVSLHVAAPQFARRSQSKAVEERSRALPVAACDQ